MAVVVGPKTVAVVTARTLALGTLVVGRESLAAHDALVAHGVGRPVRAALISAMFQSGPMMGRTEYPL